MNPKGHPQEMPPWIPRATFTVIACVLIFLAGFWLVRQLSGLLSWVVIALFLSFAIEPLTNKLEHRGWNRGRATALIITSLFIAIGIFLASMVPLVVSQVDGLIDDTPRFVDQINDFFTTKFGVTFSTDDLIRRLTELGASVGVEGEDVASNVLGVGGTLLRAVFQVLTIAIFTYYLVVDGPSIRRKTMTLMPAREQKIFLETWEIAIEKMGSYLYVRLILAGLSALTAFIVMSIAGVPFAIPLALWVGLISQFIPVIGTYIAAAVPLVVALLANPWSALAVLIYVIVYQQIENYILSPKLTEKTMQLHPAIAIGAAIAGASLYGPIGAFLALPIAAIFQVVASTYIKRHEVIDAENDLLGVGKKRPKRAIS